VTHEGVFDMRMNRWRFLSHRVDAGLDLCHYHDGARIYMQQRRRLSTAKFRSSGDGFLPTVNHGSAVQHGKCTYVSSVKFRSQEHSCQILTRGRWRNRGKQIRMNIPKSRRGHVCTCTPGRCALRAEPNHPSHLKSRQH
jgi:hypothetical protein